MNEREIRAILAPTDGQSAAVDFDRLETVLGDAAAELLVELAPVFIDANAPHLSLLAGDIQGADLDLVYKTAHTLKGSSSSIAATKLADICSGLEKAAREHDVAALKLGYAAFRLEYERVIAVLKKLG
jgi:HPt (histidine-containing phosphotransfer) domain-containing protein